MSMPVDQVDDLAACLARAFVRAWERYYVSGTSETVAEEVARPTLAKHLVALAKQDVLQETTLAEQGLAYLVSLSAQAQASGPEQRDRATAQSPVGPPEARAFHMRIGRSDARFLAQWRVPWAS